LVEISQKASNLLRNDQADKQHAFSITRKADCCQVYLNEDSTMVQLKSQKSGKVFLANIASSHVCL